MTRSRWFALIRSEVLDERVNWFAFWVLGCWLLGHRASEIEPDNTSWWGRCRFCGMDMTSVRPDHQEGEA